MFALLAKVRVQIWQTNQQPANPGKANVLFGCVNCLDWPHPSNFNQFPLPVIVMGKCEFNGKSGGELGAGRKS